MYSEILRRHERRSKPRTVRGLAVASAAAAALASGFAMASGPVMAEPQGLTLALLVEQPKILATDGTGGDQFGFSVAMTDTTAVIGAPGDDVGENADQGSAYVFVRVAGAWVLQQKLTAGDGAASDDFGTSVAIGLDTVVIGAPGDDIGLNGDQGSAYVFFRTGNIWTLQQKLTAGDGAAGDGLGASVAVSGETALVAANLDDIGPNADQGSAYVFTRGGAIWTEQVPKLTSNDGAPGDQFGSSVALSGDTALIGARVDDIATTVDQGSAYVFDRIGGTFVQGSKLTASDGALGDEFGASVALDGTTAIIGAHLDDILGAIDQGSAYIFQRIGGWTQHSPKLTANDGAGGDQFGAKVALNGNTALVGAIEDNVGSNAGQGSAYVFAQTSGAFIQMQKLTANDGSNGDGFGFGLAANGSNVLIGALSDDVGSSVDQGSVYPFIEPAPPGPQAPAPPTNLTASVLGPTITLAWNPSAGATSYRLRAGSSAGASNVFDGDIGNLIGLTAVAGAGTYFVRVHAVGPGGESGPSNEVRIDVGGGCPAPLPPTGLQANVIGSTVILTWNAAAGATSYVIEAGSAPNASNLANFDTGNAATNFTALQVPAGLYFVRVRGRNACGTDGASNEIAVIVGGSTAPGIRFP
jgi:hypothetical protein